MATLWCPFFMVDFLGCDTSKSGLIYSLRDAEEEKKFSGCKIVEGNLTIRLHNSAASVHLLEKYFGDIEEINGYLSITFSPSIQSLSFLKSLRVIHGNGELFMQKYALSVFEVGLSPY